MNYLDFLSSSPNLFIFQKKANKTNFGGVLFIIYILICLSIFIYLLLDYNNNNKFEIHYTFNQNRTLIEDVETMYNNSLLNPIISGLINLTDNETNYLNDNFVILDYSTNSIKKKFLAFEERVSDIDIGIYYKCSKENCSLREEDFRPSYTLRFCNSPYIIAHQNKESPIYRNNNLLSCHDYEFSFDTKIKKNLDWQIIKYKDKGGLFSKEKEYMGGYIKSGDVFIYDRPNFFSKKIWKIH